MEPEPSDILRALAARYERSRAGRTGQSATDLLFDYERLLREAGCDRGDPRICAERDLSDAVERGLLVIERHRRTGIPQLVRLSPLHERELFRAVNLTPPSERRQALARLFIEAAHRTVPSRWETSWRTFCEQIAAAAAAGASVAPFTRDQRDETREILALLPQLLDWQTESLRRFASSRLCGDSKRLEVLQSRLAACLDKITGGEIRTLEDLGILENERAVIVHGPLRLQFPGGPLDLGLLSAPARIDRRDLQRAQFDTSASRCLTVENLSVLHELARRKSGTLLASSGSEGGFAHSAIIEFLQALPADVSCAHCGDTDPKGFEILENLRQRTQRPIASLGMTFEDSAPGPSLTPAEQKTIRRLQDSPFLTDREKAELLRMESAGHKGIFEQEARPLVLPGDAD
ncbi:MAG TPA: DUF2220 family protein [Terrimicrobiaceae bacterium]|nr:DUF2220 family protein [Terrimicrobiaceae bacterium]